MRIAVVTGYRYSIAHLLNRQRKLNTATQILLDGSIFRTDGKFAPACCPTLNNAHSKSG
jgi:hypothetical protein